MSKQKRLPKHPKTLKEVFSNYDSVTILALINTFEQSEAWKVFKAYAATVQRRYEVDALDSIGKDGEEKKAAYASGYAKACEDVTNSFMEGLKQTALNISPVVEHNRVEEPEPQTVHDLQ